jgi:hypothetical protein
MEWSILDFPDEIFSEIFINLSNVEERFCGWGVACHRFRRLAFALPLRFLVFSIYSENQPSPLNHISKLLKLFAFQVRAGGPVKKREEPEIKKEALNLVESEFRSSPFLQKINRSCVENLAFDAFPVALIPFLREFFPNTISLKISQLNPKPVEGEESPVIANFSIFHNLQKLDLGSFKLDNITLPIKTLRKLRIESTARELQITAKSCAVEVERCSNLVALAFPFNLDLGRFPNLEEYEMKLECEEDCAHLESARLPKLTHLTMNARSDQNQRFPLLSLCVPNLKHLRLDSPPPISKASLEGIQLTKVDLSILKNHQTIQAFVDQSQLQELTVIRSTLRRFVTEEEMFFIDEEFIAISKLSNLENLYFSGHIPFQLFQHIFPLMAKLRRFTWTDGGPDATLTVEPILEILSHFNQERLENFEIESNAMDVRVFEAIDQFKFLTRLVLGFGSGQNPGIDWLEALIPLKKLSRLYCWTEWIQKDLSQRLSNITSAEKIAAVLNGFPFLTGFRFIRMTHGVKQDEVKALLNPSLRWSMETFEISEMQ